jgi:hypothetical protein
VWCVQGGGWADADGNWVLRGLGAGVGGGGGRWVGSDDWLEEGEVEQRVTDWNWNESDRMESFGFDIEGLDIPSGSLMRHRRNKGGSRGRGN